MVNTNKLVTGLIAGAALGAVAGLLFAPKPGKESRQIVAARADELRDKADGLRGKAVDYVDAMRSRRKSKENQPVLAEATNGHVNGTV
ncbi:MAG: YtxH domain-containing protein [Dehalococcoidia bacterium]|nr:YtxH domain-containing protein [Dehalococcoidia bacterium]